MRALLLLLTLLLAGCAGSVPEPVTAVEPEPEVLLDERLPGSHAHDVWGGQDVLVVADFEASGMDICTGCPWAYLSTFRLEPGQVIPQGTQFVDVTVDYTLEGASGPLHVFIQTAADDSLQHLGPVESGDTFRYESNNTRNDMGHTALSAWRFMLAAPTEDLAAGMGQFYQTSGHIVVEAVRGLEIPVEPPHPDLWENRTEIPLFEHTVGRKTTFQNENGDTRGCFFNGCPMTHTPDDGVVVPYDARAVRVALQFLDDQDLPWQQLAYHGNDHWHYEHVAPVEVGGGRQVYEIELENNGDSPYAKQSVWAFRVIWDQDTADALDQRRPHFGGYTISAEAIR